MTIYRSPVWLEAQESFWTSADATADTVAATVDVGETLTRMVTQDSASRCVEIRTARAAAVATVQRHAKALRSALNRYRDAIEKL